jgi:DNA repair protein RadC
MFAWYTETMIATKETENQTLNYTLHDNDIILGEAQNQYILRVRDLPGADKPREKMIAYGPGDLTLSEIVAIVLGVGTKKEEILQMSQRILKEYGEQSIAHETSPQRMAEILDIPVIKACQLIAAFELGRRFYATKSGRPVFIRTADQAYEHLKAMGGLNKEQLRGLYVNSRYELVHEEVISVGSLTANIVHPREVFQPAIEYGAVGVIIAHNHPSGNPEPTDADLIVTTQVKSAGTILGIDLLDHIIVTQDDFKSLIANA